MVFLRSGLVLFVSVTLVAAAIFTVLFFAWFWPTGWHAWPTYSVWHAQGIAVVTGPTYALLAFAAWRGRRHPAVDGTMLITVIAVAVCGVMYLWALNSTDAMSRGFAASWWAFCIAGLASIIPAHLLCYFGLRRSALLRDLTPEHSELKPWLDQRP